MVSPREERPIQGLSLDDVDSVSVTSSKGQAENLFSGSGAADTSFVGSLGAPRPGGLQSLVMAAHASSRLHPPPFMGGLSYTEAPTPPHTGGPTSASDPSNPLNSLGPFNALLEAYRLQTQPTSSGGAVSSSSSSTHNILSSLPLPPSAPPILGPGLQPSTLDAFRLPEPSSPEASPQLMASFSSNSSRSSYGLDSARLPQPPSNQADYGLGLRGRGDSMDETYVRQTIATCTTAIQLLTSIHNLCL